VKIPNKVNIGGTTYKVKKVRGLKANNQEVWGYCDYKNHVIAVEVDISEDVQEQAFLHECVHAINDVWGIDKEDTVDESKVDRMAHGLHALINQNKAVFKA
jgi:hypothetical protein